MSESSLTALGFRHSLALSSLDCLTCLPRLVTTFLLGDLNNKSCQVSQKSDVSGVSGVLDVSGDTHRPALSVWDSLAALLGNIPEK